MTFHGLQKLSLLDYPGKLCATLFLSGCNFRCPFCHNAALVSPSCAQNEVSEQEVLSFLRGRAGLLDAVCITGGEPLLRPTEDLASFIGSVKALGFLVKLDTNGSRPDKLSSLLPMLDYIAMDIKSSSERYGRAVGVTGIDFEPIRESARMIADGAVDYEFRTTFVGGLHAVSDADSIGRFLAEYGAKRHRIQNYREEGDILSPTGLRPMTERELSLIRETLREYVPDCEIRG